MLHPARHILALEQCAAAEFHSLTTSENQNQQSLSWVDNLHLKAVSSKLLNGI